MQIPTYTVITVVYAYVCVYIYRKFPTRMVYLYNDIWIGVLFATVCILSFFQYSVIGLVMTLFFLSLSFGPYK